MTKGSDMFVAALENEGVERRFADFGLTLGNPDFVRYAEAYGARGTLIRATEELVPVLHDAFDAGGVHLVPVPVDYSDNVRILVHELRNRVPDAAEVPKP